MAEVIKMRRRVVVLVGVEDDFEGVELGASDAPLTDPEGKVIGQVIEMWLENGFVMARVDVEPWFDLRGAELSIVGVDIEERDADD